MCLNVVTRLLEDLPGYESIKRHSEFVEYFIPDCNHSSYSWNIQIYTALRQSLLVTMTNDTCVKSSMTPQAYKVVITHAHEINGLEILYRILHSRAPHLGGMNGDIKSDLLTLLFKKVKQLEDFYSIIIRVQQEIIFSRETVSTTRLLFQYMKV